MMWRPIETAPKDGTQLWLFEGGTSRKTWRGWYDKDEGQWIWGARADDKTVAFLMRLNPTHWMPLPSEPDDV